MKMRMTNLPFPTTLLDQLRPNSTGESLNILEKNYQIDLTGFVIMCLDVWYGKTANGLWFTRCGINVASFRIMDWSKNLGVICNDDTLAETTLTTTIRKWNAETQKDIEVEFIDVDISDVSDMINWLRLQKNVFYTPPKDEKYEWVPKTELECLKKEHKKKVDAQQKELRKYQNFFDSVCEELDTTESDPDKVLEELSDDLDRLDDLEDFRSDICGVLDIDSMIGSTRQNDKRILEQVERLKKIEHEHYHVINNWYKESYLEEVLNELCDENNVVRPCSTRNYKERLEYIFEVLTNWRKRAVRAEHEHDECIKANTKDYANAKCARAELANLYKRILGEERLDPKLSPHEVAVAILKHVRGLCDLQHEANMGVKELQKFRDEVYNALNLGYPTTNQYILKVPKERLAANDFYVEGIDAAEYRAFIMRLFEAVGKPVVEEIISTQYLAKMVLEEVKELKQQNDRGTTYVKRMRELEQKLEDIKNICDGDSDILNIIGE